MVMTLVDLRDKELADHLAATLSDYEFEMLVRARVGREFSLAHSIMPDLYEGTSSCTYRHSFSDKCMWHVRIGESYSKSVEAEGEVLRLTVHDAMESMRMKYENVLSKLIAAPTATE